MQLSAYYFLLTQGIARFMTQPIWQPKRPGLLLLLLGISACLPPVSAREPFYPNDPYFFCRTNGPLYPGQWHLINQAPATLAYPVYVANNGRTKPACLITNAGLDINVRRSYRRSLTVTGLRQTDIDRVELSWQSESGQSYSVLTTPDLKGPFAIAASNVIATMGVTVFVHQSTVPAQTRFYQIVRQ